MPGGDIFIDILPRMSMTAVDKVLADVKRAFTGAGAEAGKSMSKGFDLGLADLSRNSEIAFRDVQRSMAQLDAAQADRVAAFKRGADEMVNAERRVQAAIAETNRALAASREADAAVVAGSSRAKPTERKPIVPVPRGGAVAAVATGGLLIGGLHVAAQTSGTLNDILTRHQDSPDNVRLLNQASYRIAGETGIRPQDLAAGAEAVEQAGYRGQNAVSVLETAAKVAQMAHTDIDTAVAGITTTMNDFKVQNEQDNPAKFLSDMNDIAGKLVVTLGNLKDVNPAEYFKSLANIEPIAGSYMPNVNPNQASAQVDAIASVASQAGMPPERAMLNAAQMISQLGNPKGPKAKALEQLGLKPGDISATVRDQGIVPVLDMINNAIQSRYDANTGLYNMGWKFNDAGQLKSLQQIDIDQLQGMGDQGQAALALLQTTSFQNATATNKSIQKAFNDAGITDPTVTGAVKNWLKFQKIANGPSAFVQGGQMPELTQAQVISNIAGTGDVQRSVLPLLQNLPELKQMLAQYSEQGNAQGFQNAFQQWQQSLPAKMKILEGQLEEFAGTIGEKILPEATRLAQDLNAAADWLDKHKAAEQALVAVMSTLAAAWGASKLINLGKDLLPALSFAADKARALGQLMSDRLPTQIAAAGTGAEALGVAETTAAGEVATAGEKAGLAATGAETLATAETTTAEEVSAGGAGLGAKVAGIGTAALALTAAIMAAKAAIDWGTAKGNADLMAHSPFGPDTPTILPGMGQPNPGAPVPGLITAPDSSKPQLPTNSAGQPTIGGIPMPGLTNPSLPVQSGQGPEPKYITGHAEGGIVDQPLIGQPDTGGDSILGLLPNGMPVGLRGGEGILTPETVQALGGEDAINALNANPWSNPFKAATSIYGSFAKGVAKYSPWGKYLAATGQTLDSLEQASEAAQQTQRKGQRIIFPVRYSSPYGAYSYGSPTGSHRSRRSMGAIDAALSGLSPSDADDVKWIMQHESGFNPGARNPSSGAYGLGQFLGHEHDKYGAMGAYSGDPTRETHAMLAYIRDRYGSPAAAKQFWEAHHWYSTGGVIPQPRKPAAPPKPPARPSHPSHPATGPHRPTQGAKQPVGKHKPASLGDVMNIVNSKLDKDAANPAKGDRNIKANPSKQLTAEGKGFGIGGGLIGTAESAASMAADAFAPGSGQAAQQLFQLVNLAAGYGGQLFGIGMEGIMETLLPNDSPAADPSKNIFGKIALGIAGAHPSGKNLAGSHAKQLEPKKDLDKGAMQAKQQPTGHTFNFGDIHNAAGDHDLQKAVNHAVNIGTFANI